MITSQMNVDELKVQSPFSKLFPISGETLDGVIIDMKTNGFDSAFPVIVWEGENIIVDGHTRFRAANDLGIESVPVLLKPFENEDDAVLYAFHIQRNRRNMADDDILRCLEVLDSLNPQSLNKSESETPLTKKESSELAAKELGVSKNKIDKARKVLEHGDDDVKEAVQSGEKSINMAFNEIQDKRRESGELKGQTTNGLACSTRYRKTVETLRFEIKNLKDDGWEQIAKDEILQDLMSIQALLDE